MVDLNFYKGKKVFITGHTGFKGSWLASILLLLGAKVFGYSLQATKEQKMFDKLALASRMKSEFANICELDKLQKCLSDFEPEIVFHLAAQPLVRESYKNPVLTYQSNVMGTVNLLEACRTVKSIKSIVNVTTDKVYENREWNWGYRENENLCGFDPYSNSKSCAELVTYSYKNCFFASDASPAVSTARSGNVIGGGDYSSDRIIPDCVRAAEAGEDIIVRNPFSARPYQHVLECLRGYLTLAARQYNKLLSGCYNFGPDDADCVKTGDLVNIFCNAWGKCGWQDKHDGGPHEASFLKLDCQNAKTKLGWYPKWGITKAVTKTVEWYKAEGKNENMWEFTSLQIKDYFEL